MKNIFKANEFFSNLDSTPAENSGNEEEDKKKEEGREVFLRLCGRLLLKVAEWATKEGLEIEVIKKLGGGFVNPVILIETKSGRSVVVKGFVEIGEAVSSKKAKKIIDTISAQDEKMLSEVVEWLDDDIVLTEKVEGESARKKIERVKNQEMSVEDASKYFESMGRLLGNLHERTEQKADLFESEGIHEDREKIKKALEKYSPDPVYLPIPIDELCNILDRNTAPNFVAYIHGDAHMDQFFCSPNEDIITIVDYDKMRHGDPMADLARAIGSIRAWSKKIGLDASNENTLVSSLIGGYRAARNEQPNSKESEFDYLKITSYEMRLYLVELKQFDGLREKIKSEIIGKKDFAFDSEKGLYDSILASTQILDTEMFSEFTSDEKEKIKHMMDVLDRINDCVDYLSSTER